MEAIGGTVIEPYLNGRGHDWKNDILLITMILSFREAESSTGTKNIFMKIGCEVDARRALLPFNDKCFV